MYGACVPRKDYNCWGPSFQKVWVGSGNAKARALADFYKNHNKNKYVILLDTK